MATAAEPVLASALWDPKHDDTPPKRRLPAKCTAIDTALHGGLDHGSITCISAEADAGARDFSQALLVSHLLGTSDAHATVIDTGQAVDVRQLYHALIDALSGAADAAEKAKAVLGRLRMTKIFDFEGLTDGVSELRDVLEGRIIAVEAQKAPLGTVADSQDDEDEMLDASMPLLNTSAPAVTGPSFEPSSNGGLLVIDNITQLAAPLLKANYASGQALLTSFMRSLGHLTQTHDLCTLVLNGTIPIKNSKDETPSAFASCPGRPALGNTWPHLVDVHLLMHRMPKTVEDAKGLYGVLRKDGVEMVSVIEVVQDRYEGRVGRWAAFRVVENGRLKDAI